MATEYGFIYVLSNSSMPGIYKIGYTANHPNTRMEQLSAATACPTPFSLLAAFGVEGPREVEREIHTTLSKHRINQQREFFKVPTALILEAIKPYVDPYDDLANTFMLEADAFAEKITSDEAWKRSYFSQQDADPIWWPARIDFSAS